MLSRLSIRLIFLISSILYIGSAHAIEFSESKYDVYFGDFNGDGKSGDFYFHAKDVFILIHGDVPTPLLIKDSNGFVFYEGGDGNAHPLTLTSDELAYYMRAIEGIHYAYGDFNSDGIQDLRLEAVDGLNFIYFYGVGSSDIASISISEQLRNANPDVFEYQYDALRRLTDVIDSVNGDRGYTYDDAGNRTSVTTE